MLNELRLQPTVANLSTYVSQVRNLLRLLESVEI